MGNVIKPICLNLLRFELSINSSNFLCFIGQSTSETNTIKEASLLKQQGVTVFSIGVGSGPRQSELQGMASKPYKKHVFTVSSFNALNSIKATLQKSTCDGMFYFGFSVNIIAPVLF